MRLHSQKRHLVGHNYYLQARLIDMVIYQSTYNLSFPTSHLFVVRRYSCTFHLIGELSTLIRFWTNFSAQWTRLLASIAPLDWGIPWYPRVYPSPAGQWTDTGSVYNPTHTARTIMLSRCPSWQRHVRPVPQWTEKLDRLRRSRDSFIKLSTGLPNTFVGIFTRNGGTISYPVA